jgi:hypothetical protein
MKKQKNRELTGPSAAACNCNLKPEFSICKDPYRTAGGPRLPSSEKSSRAFATTSSSRSRPIAVSTGAVWLELTVGLALCAATQIEQEADSVRVG